MTTIKLKNGSGAPLAGDLVQGEPALDLTNKRLYTENSSGTVIEVGTNPGEDVTFADNRKAIFGAGSDLQIYHDGSNSYVQDAGTGNLYLRASNAIIMQSADGAETIASFHDDNLCRLYFDNAVKLATTSTGIDVTGTVTADGLVVEPSSATGLTYAADGTNSYINFEANSVSDSVQLYAGQSSGGYFSIGTKSSGGSLAERMRIDSSGNVGVGTSSPSSFNYLSTSPHLVIGGGSSDAGVTYYSSTNGYGRLAFADGTNTTEQYRGLIQFYHGDNSMQFYTGSDERMRIDASGNLIVGGTASDASGSITLQNDGDIRGVLAAGVGGDTLISGVAGVSNGYQISVTSGNAHTYRWHNGNVASMTLDSSGVVSIGDTGSGSASRLYVLGASTNSNIGVARFNTTGDDESSSCIAVVKNSSSTSTSNVFIRFGVANYNSGCGQINANGTSQAAFGSFSDRRLKENITDLPSQLENITALRPVEFDYIESEGGGHQIGFIAQEVEEIYPDLVGERHDGMKTLTGINKMEARLIKAIQEQNELINDLRARVAQLEGAN